MTKLKYAAFVLVIVAITMVIIWQQQRIRRLTADVAALRNGTGQLPALQDEHDRLAAQLKTAPRLPPAELEELLRLRAQVGAAEKLAQQNGLLKTEIDRMAKRAAGLPEERNPYNDHYYGANSENRSRHAMRWSSAVFDYAKQHQGQFPEGLPDAAQSLTNYTYNDQHLSDEEQAQTMQTADQYELVYHGTLEGMTNPPSEATIILREKQPRQTDNGKWARYYVIGGIGMYRTSDDGNFDEFERTHMQRSDGR